MPKNIPSPHCLKAQPDDLLIDIRLLQHDGFHQRPNKQKQKRKQQQIEVKAKHLKEPAGGEFFQNDVFGYDRAGDGGKNVGNGFQHHMRKNYEEDDAEEEKWVLPADGGGMLGSDAKYRAPHRSVPDNKKDPPVAGEQAHDENRQQHQEIVAQEIVEKAGGEESSGRRAGKSLPKAYLQLLAEKGVCLEFRQNDGACCVD